MFKKVQFLISLYRIVYPDGIVGGVISGQGSSEQDAEDASCILPAVLPHETTKQLVEPAAVLTSQEIRPRARAGQQSRSLAPSSTSPDFLATYFWFGFHFVQYLIMVGNIALNDEVVGL